MPKYAAEGNRATSTTTATVLEWHASSGTKARRLKFYFLSIGFPGTPGDVEVEIIAQRTTAAGTVGGAVVPKPLDFADDAALSVAGEAHSVEPTYTTAEAMLSLPVHQRNTVLWYAPPGGEIVVPATNLAGLGVQTDASSGTPTCTAVLHAEE